MIGNLHIVPLLSLLSGLANAALAAFVIGKDFHSPVNRWLAGLAVSFSFWGIGEFFMRTAADPVSAMFWVKFEALGYVAVGSLYLLFAYHYSKQGDRLRNNWMRVLLWAPPMVFLGIFFIFQEFS